MIVENFGKMGQSWWSASRRQTLYSPLQVLDLLETKREESDALAVGGVVRQPPLDASSERGLLVGKISTWGTDNPEADGNRILKEVKGVKRDEMRSVRVELSVCQFKLILVTSRNQLVQSSASAMF
ncbi:predicted protein [Chaetomium globosum CBS 148.51]|uniref:Uncharacterized protein n=1 Tax=Chaetomium globosum (strain ATCC 6205 / CBS 148.51 / DSM 1962 / NBRC 6347 / NRRL 1970) TaxID=306901 RepID=Q2HHQ6_CHAGB|nr:uncharacterized protein CHGG_00248 [Chaetomium globosum CBS 148.51]EAQ92013.1 predicted protein [Chaetomium globosum CBS 148.51]